MYEQECVPFAPTLIESMRTIGYSFLSAVVDLLDNSIGTRATRIDIISEPSENPSQGRNNNFKAVYFATFVKTYRKNLKKQEEKKT